MLKFENKALTDSKLILDWIEEMANMVNPDKIVWIDGSEEQTQALRDEACAIGELEKLNDTQEKETLSAEEEIRQIKVVANTKRLRTSSGIIIDGERGCQVKFAKCCNPLPGDKIVGFITRGFGVSVHKADCPNVTLSRSEDNLSRWVKAEWDAPATQGTQAQETYEAMIQIVVEDGIGVIASISVALADMKVSITAINTQLQKDGTMLVNLSVGCKNTAHYESIVSKLRSIKSVVSVARGFSH